VIFRRLANDAMRSDPRAVKLLLSLVDRYAESPEATIKFSEMLAEDQAILARYLRESGSINPVTPSTFHDEGRKDGG
jgi:hypothetical protein